MGKKQPDTSDRNNQGYTKLPNWIFGLMALRDGDRCYEAELRVTLAIARLTVGWQKEWDRISISQFQKMTDLSRQGVIDGIEAALARGTIERRADGQYYEYKLVNSVDQSNEQTSQVSRPEVVNSVDQLGLKLVNSVDTQKKDRKKRKKEGDAGASPPPEKASRAKAPRVGSDPNTKAILDTYKDVLGYNSINYGKEGQAAKKLARDGWTPEQVAACYRQMKADEFWANKHLSLQKVYEQIGAWHQSQKPQPSDATGATVAGIRVLNKRR